MDKYLIRIEINNLLDRYCHGCELIKGVHQDNRLLICKTCPHYKQIRQLGDQLLIKEDKKMSKPIMTIDQYKEFVSEGLTPKEIASRLMIETKAVYAWKFNHKDEIKNAGIESKTVKNAPKMNENAQKVNDSANKLVANKLSNRVKEQESVIAKLRVSLGERDRQVDALLADKKKLLEEQGRLNSGIENPQITCLKEQLDTEKKLNESVHHNLGIAQKTIVQLKNEKADLLNSTQNQASTIDALQKNLDSANKLYQEKCKQVADLNAAAEDLENEISQLKDDKNDLEHQLAYTGQERDKYFKLARRYGQQLKALEAYVVTILESAK